MLTGFTFHQDVDEQGSWWIKEDHRNLIFNLHLFTIHPSMVRVVQWPKPTGWLQL